MTKFQPTTDASSTPAMPYTVHETASQKDQAAGAAKQAAQRADPLPWLIRQLRGRYECGQVSADNSIADRDA